MFNQIKKPFKEIKAKINEITRLAENQQYWDEVARQIGPATIKEFSEYVMINNNIMARTIIAGIPPTSDIGGYPSDMKPTVIDELLDISAKGHSIAFSYTIIPIPNQTSMKMLDHAMFMNRVAQESFKDKPGKNHPPDPKKQPPLKYGLEAQDFAANYEQVYKNSQKMYHTAFIIVIWGKDRDILREAESHVIAILQSNRIYFEVPDYRHLATFLAAQPYPQWQEYTWCELFSYHTAALLPTRNPNSRTDDIGLYFGEDLKTGKDILIDLKTLAAQHLMFAGSTGAGKTFTLLVLLIRAFDMLGKRIIYTTPKADVGTNYRNVAEYYGKSACIIDIGPRGKNINPLQILYDESVMKDELDYIHAFDDHCELVNKFFTVLFENTATRNMSSTLNESLIQVYRSKGIMRNNPDTWKDANWPTLYDLRAVWEHNLQEDPKDVTTRALLDKTYQVNTSWSYMNRPTDINLSADFIVVDLSGVPESIKEALNVFVTGIMSMRFRTDTKKETIIAVDEGAVYLRNPQLSMFLLRTLTQGRSFNVSLWLATQQPADLQKANLDAEFKTNIQISIVLGNMRKDTISHVKNFYSLNENNVSDLMTCGVGEGLIIVGDEIIPTKFKPTQHEMDIIKGTLKSNKDIQNTSEKTVLDGVFKPKEPSLLELISEHGIYFEEWLEDNYNISNQGYQSVISQRAVGRGTIRAWVRSDLIEGQMIGNQTVDHYTTVMQLAGWLRMRGIKVTVNHYEDVDVVADFGADKIAFEYEKTGTHTTDQLLKKKCEAEKQYSDVFFIGSVENIKYLIGAVGINNAVRRGTQLEEFLEDLINTKTEKKQ